MTLFQPCFIVFEGLDGSGKSTCARRLAEWLDAEWMTTPSPDMRRYRDEVIADLGPSQEARQLFYLATVFAASHQVCGALSVGRSVVIDRYFLSTMAYAAFRGSLIHYDECNQLLQPAHVTIYLDTSLATRRERLASRGTSTADLETITSDADARLQHEHMRRSQLPVVGRFVRVSGDGSQDEVFERVTDAVGRIVALPIVPKAG